MPLLTYCNKYKQVKINCRDVNNFPDHSRYCDLLKFSKICFFFFLNSAWPSLLGVCFSACRCTWACIGVCERKSLSPAVVHQDTVMSNDRSTLIYHAFPLLFFFIAVLFHMVLEQMTIFLTMLHIFTARILFPGLGFVFSSFCRALLGIRESFRMSRQSMSVLLVQLCQ